MFGCKINLLLLLVLAGEKLSESREVANSSCRPKWLNVGSQCIRVGQIEVAYKHASAYCNSFHPQGKLMTIHSQAEQDFVLQILLNNKKDKLWIGASFGRVTKDSGEEAYRWNDFSEITYSNFGHDIKAPYVAFIFGRYVAVRAPAGKWYAQDDSNISPLCAYPVLSEYTTQKCSTPHENFMKHNSSCYLVIEQKKTWQEAEEHCRSLSSHLLSVKDSQENNEIWLNRGVGRISSSWIGLRSEQMSSFLSWSDSSPAFYWNWGNNEPLAIEADRCAAFYTEFGKWFVASCEEKKPFICEHKMGESIWTMNPPGMGNCPSGEWRDFGGEFCYYYGGHGNIKWNLAHKKCMAMNSSLVSIHSDKENEILSRSLKELGSAWIGARETFHSGLKWSDWSSSDFESELVTTPRLDSHTRCVVLTSADKWLTKECNSDGISKYICKAKKR